MQDPSGLAGNQEDREKWPKERQQLLSHSVRHSSSQYIGDVQWTMEATIGRKLKRKEGRKKGRKEEEGSARGAREGRGVGARPRSIFLATRLGQFAPERKTCKWASSGCLGSRRTVYLCIQVLLEDWRLGVSSARSLLPRNSLDRSRLGLLYAIRVPKRNKNDHGL
jgi:hypothetical protein